MKMRNIKLLGILALMLGTVILNEQIQAEGSETDRQDNLLIAKGTRNCIQWCKDVNGNTYCCKYQQ